MEQFDSKKTYRHPFVERIFLFFIVVCLISLVSTFLSDFQKINFTATNDLQTITQVEKSVDNMIELLKKNNAIFISTENTKLKSDKYNNLAQEYNQITQEINSSIKNSKDLMPLKVDFITLNNQAFELLENTRTHLEKRTSRYVSNTYDLEQFIKKYTDIKNHPALQKNRTFDLNSETVQFIIAIGVLTLSSITLIILLILSRKRIEHELSQTESELKTFKSVINNMSEGVIVSDRFGFFTYYNQSALDIIGNTVKDVYYESSLELLGFYDNQNHKLTKETTPFSKAFKKTIISDEEIFVQNEKNPEGIYISASNGFFTDLRGNAAGAVVVMKNITSKKQLEELWKKEKLVAIEASQKKSDFLATMSHEIRTPMNGIIGLTHLLNETQMSPVQKEYTDTISRSAQSLLSLINDILDHSKIEAGKVEIVKKNFDLHFLMRDILDSFRYMSHEKNLELHLEINKNIETHFIADANRIKQIVMNLVGNAIKFTTNGKITLKLELQKDYADSATIKFSVTDTGPGMSDIELERLFQRFFQTKTGIQFGGTGLGLNICKQLVDLMKGEIGVESQLGNGSTFWFILPLDKGEKNSLSVQDHPHLTIGSFENQFKGKVLVAEDNLINQKVVHQYLTKIGCEVDLVNNGQEAVEAFKTRSYDLILMDCNMPVMDGFTASRKITEMQSQDLNLPQTKIVALTAEGINTGLEKCQNAGMVDFINKPILIPEFINILKKHLTWIENTNQQLHEDTDMETFENKSLYKLKDLKAGNQLLIEVLFDDFKESTPGLLNSLKSAIETADAENIHDISHSLKSVSGTLGATVMSDICMKLELQTKLPPTEKMALFQKLDSEFKISLEKIEHDITVLKEFKPKVAS